MKRPRVVFTDECGPAGSVPVFKEADMRMTYRILICIGIILVDLLVFFLPLTAFFLVYILLLNPPWFRDFLQQINQADRTS